MGGVGRDMGDCGQMGKQINRTNGFMARLAHNEAGNVLAIVAAAIFPLAGLIGGGIDVSRLYLAKTRLQQACDAGALAGRRSMSGITWTTGANSNEETAKNFFNLNFPANKYGAGAPTIHYAASNTGAVTGTASVAVPMTLMKLFGFSSRTISAECTADLQLPNTDVMFVLDTTLSMNDVNPGDSESRIAVLRTAVQNFYNALQQVKPAGSHIRYGFVPYSSTVNVGMLLKRNWIQDNPVYDSRVPDGTSVIPGSTQGGTITTNTSVVDSGNTSTGTKYQGSSETCSAPANSLSDNYTAWSAWSPSATALPRSRTRVRTRNGVTYSAGLNKGVCWITPTNYNNLIETYTQTVSENPNAGDQNADGTAYHWIYKPVTYPAADLKGAGSGDELVSGGFFTAPVSNKFAAARKISWTQANACIEERATRRNNEGTDVPRYDMDIDLIPDPAKPETQWKPFLPGVVYGRRASGATSTSGWEYSGSAPTYTRVVSPNSTTDYYTPNGSPDQYGACPTYARKLAEIDSSTLSTYMKGLTTAGFTYHDIGMLWGLRLMSREGLFAAEHAAAESTGRYARNLIFMTDGETDTRIGSYDAWGVSAVSRRRTSTASIPTNADQNAITEARLSELCTIAKTQKNITVWVIAFGTNLSTMLSNCASPGRAYQADNADQLTTTFSQIASQIAQLRITR